MNINDLILSIIKIKDSEVGLEVYSSLVSVLNSYYNDIVELIDDLYDVLQDSDYIDYIESLVGRNNLNSVKDWLIDNIAYLQKIKGTKFSWEKYFSYLYENIGINELYKDEVYEDDDWEEIGLIKSSKVSFSCETIAETILDINTQEGYFEQIESIVPIHVSLVRDSNEISLIDTIDYIDDSIGCIYCETICEEVCESVDETNTSINYGYFTTGINYITDSVDLTLKCIATCETTCEDCCETSCECDACELYCESSCEKNQTHGTGYYNGVCITFCETACESQCEIFCEWSCQNATKEPSPECVGADHFESGCSLYCESDICEACHCECVCEIECTAGCQGQGCQAICENICEGLGGPCETSCTAACETYGESPCASQCELVGDTSCDVGCEYIDCQIGCEIGACEVICQFGCEHDCEDQCISQCMWDIGCQFGCEEDCESTCEVISCQCDCQSVCMVHCEAGGAGGCQVFGEANGWPFNN